MPGKPVQRIAKAMHVAAVHYPMQAARPLHIITRLALVRGIIFRPTMGKAGESRWRQALFAQFRKSAMTTTGIPAAPILIAQNARVERFEPPSKNPPVEDALPWSPAVNSFILNNALASVPGLWTLAMFNPSIRMGLAEEFRQAAKRDGGLRGQALERLSKALYDSAGREFAASRTRPSSLLMAQVTCS